MHVNPTGPSPLSHEEWRAKLQLLRASKATFICECRLLAHHDTSRFVGRRSLWGAKRT